jgi:hypothetical protein
MMVMVVVAVLNGDDDMKLYMLLLLQLTYDVLLTHWD